jgi:LDH2 family malate/lactate/ureidoglycolate dehydrogenase
MTERTDSPLHGDERVAKGVVLIAIDPTRFVPLDEFRAAVDTLIRDARSGERAEGVDRIWLPGEPEHERALIRNRDGIPLSPPLIAELQRLAGDVGAEPLKVATEG